VTDIANDAMQHLMNYAWPGNVRELKNAMAHAFVTVSSDVLTILDLPPELRTHQQESHHIAFPASLTPTQVEERRRIVEALRQTNGSKTQAAKLLGISRVTLWKKLNKLGI
jgi:transcriptional regulator of acetoin/glycerol metabolism